MAKKTNIFEFIYDDIKGTVELKDGRYYFEYDGKKCNHKSFDTLMDRHCVHKHSMRELGIEVKFE